MQEKSKEKREDTHRVETETLADDQKERSYYYDDAHGYEEYVEDETDDKHQNSDEQNRGFD